MGMNPDVKAEWVKRLREPDRKQIRGKLQTNQGQCCLGVLCEIAVEQGVIDQRIRDCSQDTFMFEDEAIEYDGATRMPTTKVAEWAGLEINRGELKPPKDAESGWDIVYLNDTGAPFSKIADIIENQL